MGDYVQWTSSGVDQFKQPRRVVWVSDDGGFARVHGEQMGIPMNELSVMEPPSTVVETMTANSAHSANNSRSRSDFSVLQRGKRLEISADVDSDGLANLQEVLTKYEEILKLMK